MHERERDMLRTLLGHVLDPEKVNEQAFADQRRLIAELGGEDAIKTMASFGYTPVG
jgi:choline-sulfatase